MQLIDRYILKLFFLYLLAGILVFVTLFLMVNIMSFALHYADAPTSSLIKYYAYYTPWVIYQLLPVASLMATLFTLSTLNRTNELTALFSVGMGLARVAAPILIAVAAVSAVAFFVADQTLPRLIQKRNYVEYVEIQKKPGLYSTVKTNKIWFRSENILFNIKTLNPGNATAQGIMLYYFDPDWQLTQLISADRVEMKGNTWDLHNGLVTLFATESSFPLTKSFRDKSITMNEDLKDIQSTANSSDVMSLKELGRFIERNKEAGLETLSYEVDYQAKLGFGCAGLIMCLVAVPFSVGRARSGGIFLNLVSCLGLAFLYWIAYSSCITLGQHGALPPVAAAWGPNILAVLLAWFLMKRLRR